jgi:hypothetical protein
MCCLAEKVLPERSYETYDYGFLHGHKPKKKPQDKAEEYFRGTPRRKFQFNKYFAPAKKQVALVSISTARDVSGEFRVLAKEWREETGADSSLTRITSHPDYLRIIALGRRAIPLILKELRKQPEPWFVALRAITGEQNIGKQHVGNFAQIAREWIRWGEANGHI